VTVRNADATLHVTIRGRGQPIVFIPSLGRGVDDFDDVSRRLVAAGYEAVLPDPRGLGGSTGPLQNITLHDVGDDVAAVIESIGWPAVVVGHAYGNRVARMIAVDHPSLVKSVVLLAAGGKIPRTPEMDQAFRLVFDAAASPAERLDAIQKSFFAKGNDAAVWRGGWDLNVGTAQRKLMQRPAVQEWWDAGSVPVLVLQATEDAIAVPENAKLLHNEFPDRVTVVDIPNSGHAMLPEQPGRIADAIIGWLRR
jgi:pimeloyl-ACP methyl ester carboxylesterase